ncbi:MAG: Ig-like domain-containing protein [Promethearchaeota archaeon]
MQQKTTSKIILLVLLLSLLQSNIAQPLVIQNYLSNLSSSAGEVYDCVDAWIIIAGDRDDHDKWNLILLTTEWVYDKVVDCGCLEEDIYYLVADHMLPHTSREDGVANDANIHYAFNTWAVSKVGPNGVLGVYMFDHGNVNVMAIWPHGTYTATELDDDLDGFETASGCDRIIVIYEACESGTFLDEPSQSDRIIITSTSPGYGSFPSTIPPHRGMFADAFFSSLGAGNSVGDAFVDATNDVKLQGYWQKQQPCIEDNHDGVGHIVNAWGELPSSWDGIDANKLYLCVDCPSNIITLPVFTIIPLKFFYIFNPTLITIPLSVKVVNVTEINTCYVRAVPSDWVPPSLPDNDTLGDLDPAEDTYRWPLTWDAASGNYTGLVELLSPSRGDYDLIFIVTDNNGYHGPIVKTQVGINNDGEAPIDVVDPTVWIKNPFEGDTISENITIVAEGADDNSGLDQIQLLIDGVLLDNVVMPDYLPYPEVSYTLDPTEYRNGEHNITAIATDNAGNSASFSVIMTIRNPISWITWTIVGGAAVGVVIVAMLINSVRKKKRKK